MRLLCTALMAVYLVAPSGDDIGSFSFFHPTVVLSPADLARLSGGAPLVRFLPASGRDVGAFTAIAVSPTVTVDRATAWMRQVELLRQNRYVLASQRLTSPPRLSDFDRLVLDDDDLDEIRQCVPGRCGVKLTGADIKYLTDVAATAGSDWKPHLQQAFRRMLLRRVSSFAAGGLPALDDIVDKKRPSSPAGAMGLLLEHTAFLDDRLPDLASQFVGSNGSDADRETFMYWSKERLGGKPVITVTHMTLMADRARIRPPVLMVGTQVYASHYLDASLTVTAFVQDSPASRGYFVYLHRSSVDLLGGFWGGIARSMIESRVRKDGPAILRAISERLANGDPPTTSDRHGGPPR